MPGLPWDKGAGKGAGGPAGPRVLTQPGIMLQAPLMVWYGWQ